MESVTNLTKANFSYTPHITLKYIETHEDLPVQRVEPVDVTFNKITLSIAGLRKDFELVGTEVAKAQTPPNLRPCTGAHSCENCGAYDDGKCQMFNDYPVKADQVCDDWVKEYEVSKATGSKEGTWITVNGQHILVGADGKPLAGNPRALGRKAPSAKVELARKNAVLTGAYEQRIADKAEQKLSSALGIPRTANNSAFDLRSHDVGIEVKCLVTGKNDKLTMGKAALGRKLAEQRAEGLKGYTVAVDMRGRASGKYYVREGFGSFRLGSMHPITITQLRSLVRG